MLKLLASSIPYLYYTLLFSVPLILYPYTSELFEFNKMIVTYSLTVMITAAWITRSIIKRKFIFKRTLLDVPIVLFLISQLLSTITSIDFRTSLLGYYSRYHGGLLSYVSYAVLYWGFVSNMDRKKTLKSIYIILASAVFVSIYGVLEHFGIDKDIWVQDVQTRVFSTLGQPNWLAAWLVALIPLPIAFLFTSNEDIQERSSNEVLSKVLESKVTWILMYSLFFITLIYTKSRSGFVGFITASVALWGCMGWLTLSGKVKTKNYLKPLAFFTLTTLIIILSSGTPWAGSIFDQVKSTDLNETQTTSSKNDNPAQRPVSPQLEIDSFSSTEIRKIVWEGAVELWKDYPILGTGVETFAYSYYNTRPVEHNLVSEWDFLYNKAHNEYLNFAATTGALGLGTYIFLILATLYLFTKRARLLTQLFKFIPKTIWEKISDSSQEIRDTSETDQFLIIALLSGYTSILITNFFGFSVVPVGLQFFLFPAFAVGLHNNKEEPEPTQSVNSGQKIAITSVIFITLYLLYLISQYWYADVFFAKGRAYNDLTNYVKAREHLTSAIEMSPREEVFWEELAQSSMGIAISLYESDNELYKQFVESAVAESEKALELSPKSINAHRKYANILLNLSPLNESFLQRGAMVLERSIELAPTEAKLYYNLGLTYLRMGNHEKAEEILTQTIEMKPNYAKARIAYAILLSETDRKEKAVEELNYVLEYINPNNKTAQQQLEEIKGN